MRALLQRVRDARVTVAEEERGAIGPGLVIFLGIGAKDTTAQATTLARKIAHLRIFSDDDGRFQSSALDRQADLLVVSQFTLYADCRRGRRPSFSDAARPEAARPLYDTFLTELRSLGLHVATGQFQAMMVVDLRNDGPVTIWLDTDEE